MKTTENKNKNSHTKVENQTKFLQGWTTKELQNAWQEGIDSGISTIHSAEDFLRKHSGKS